MMKPCSFMRQCPLLQQHHIHHSHEYVVQEQVAQVDFMHSVKGGAFEVQNDNPFGVGASEGINRGRFDTEWPVTKYRAEYDQVDYLCRTEFL